MKTEFLIAGLTAQAVKDLYGLEIDESSVQVQKTRKEFEGHLTVGVPLPEKFTYGTRTDGCRDWRMD